MNPRILYFCCATMLFAVEAMAEGSYQRTRDDKTTVWNNAPKAGETSAWNGDRDNEGYATGFGTLTWYTANSDVYARYYGNMIHGKFDGPVNVHSKGKTAYAIFIDGQRTSRWARGRAPSAPAIAQRLEAARKKVAKVAEKENSPAPNATPPKDETAVTAAERPVTEKPPAEPDPAKREPAPSAGANNDKEKAQNSIPNAFANNAFSPPTEGSTPAKTERPVTETPAEGQIAKKPEVVQRSEMDSHSTPNPPMDGSLEDVQRPPTEAPAPGLVGYKEAVPEKQVSKREENTKRSKPDAPLKPSPPKDETPAEKNGVDTSVRTMMQPPSSLRASSSGDALPPEAHLTKEDAIELADSKARNNGYDLNAYHRPKTNYDAANGTWSLVYDRKEADGLSESNRSFGIAIDEKDKKATIVPDR
ncbi:MAG: hypothetical protein ABI925_04730 [Verrucomicrobiota bacterium]